MNPYYLAYLRAGGLCQPMYKFNQWVMAKHREFRLANKLPLDPCPNIWDKEYQPNFYNFLLIGPHEKI